MVERGAARSITSHRHRPSVPVWYLDLLPALLSLPLLLVVVRVVLLVLVVVVRVVLVVAVAGLSTGPRVPAAAALRLNNRLGLVAELSVTSAHHTQHYSPLRRQHQQQQLQLQPASAS